MLVALGGVIAGYDGSFSFERIGHEYPDTVPYVAMRLVSHSRSLVTFYYENFTNFVIFSRSVYTFITV